MIALGIAGVVLAAAGWVAWGIYEFWPKRDNGKGL